MFKSTESLYSLQKDGYDHLYTEPCNLNDKKIKKTRRKGKYLFSKKSKNQVECYPKPKKSHSFFGFPYRKSSKRKRAAEQRTFLDSRDCNRLDGFRNRSFQELCQHQYQSAKEITKTIYNKLRYRYNFSLSFSTVVYSDRYFRYHQPLDTKIMPMKCFVANDMGAPVLYKKFSKIQNNHNDFFINCHNSWQQENMFASTRHYMPIFTSWGLQPYSCGAGPLSNFGDGYLFYFTDRRFFHRSIFEDLQIFYEKNRHLNANYKPVFDIMARCREMLDYDEYIHPYVRMGDINHKQLQPLFYLEQRYFFHYRMSEYGVSECKRFTEYEITKKRKQAKKHDAYQPMKGKLPSKFPVPDFALSDDQLLMRKKGSLYEKIKSDPEKIYDKFMKDSPRISSANLTHAEIHHSFKDIDKTYSTRKKVLNTDVQVTTNSLSDRVSQASNKTFNNDRASLRKFRSCEKLKESSKPLGNLERNNMIVMEPLLLMQTLDEDRAKRHRATNLKNQKIMVRVMLTYTSVIYTLCLITFYFFSLSD